MTCGIVRMRTDHDLGYREGRRGRAKEDREQQAAHACPACLALTRPGLVPHEQQDEEYF